MGKQKIHYRTSRRGKRFLAGSRSRTNEYEITLTGRDDIDEYGFYPNPPIVVHAPSKIDALRQLDTQWMKDKGVRVASIKRVG